MEEFPHHYSVTATGNREGIVNLRSPGLPHIESAPPAEFDGPGDQWSPETLLVAAIADCFILTFRAIARASKMDWISISCNIEGVLDRPNKVSRFTEFRLRVTLDAPQSIDQQTAQRLLEKSERSCLITNSLNADVHLETDVRLVS